MAGARRRFERRRAGAPGEAVLTVLRRPLPNLPRPRPLPDSVPERASGGRREARSPSNHKTGSRSIVQELAGSRRAGVGLLVSTPEPLLSAANDQLRSRSRCSTRPSIFRPLKGFLGAVAGDAGQGF